MKITDELLYQNAGEARDLWLATYPGREEVREHIFSRRFENKMRTLRREYRRSPKMNYFLRGLKTSAAVILIVATVMFSSLMTVEAYREKLIEVVTQVFEELTEYRFTSSSDAPGAQDVTFGYVPEGMKETSRENYKDYGFMKVICEGENDEYISLAIYITSSTSETTMALDTEDAEVTTGMVHGKEATFVDKEDGASILWTEGNNIFCLSGSLSMSETQRIAEGLQIS